MVYYHEQLRWPWQPEESWNRAEGPWRWWVSHGRPGTARLDETWNLTPKATVKGFVQVDRERLADEGSAVGVAGFLGNPPSYG